MAHLEFFVVTESLAVDKYTNRLSLFNILDQVGVGMIPSAAAVVLWDKEEGDDGKDFQAKLVVRTPGGKTSEYPMNFQINTKRHRTMQVLVGLVLEKAGILEFEVLLNGEHKAKHTVYVEEPMEKGSSQPQSGMKVATAI